MGLGAAALPSQATMEKIAVMCPAEILALIQAGGGVPTAASLGATIAAVTTKAITDADAAHTAQGLQLAKTVGEAIGLGDLVAEVAKSGYSLGQAIGHFLGQHAPHVECRKPVNWPARWYYSQHPPTDTSAGAQKAAEILWPMPAPGTLAAMLIAPLCQAFSSFENCNDSPIATASNLFIASTVNMWNQGAIGPAQDYFVPFVPSTVWCYYGWPGWGTTGNAGGQRYWAGGGDIWNDTTGFFGGQAATGNYAWPPPFVVPGQAEWAFRPLKDVPTNVANPKTEYIPGTNVKQLAKTGKFAFSVPPGGSWSRIRANSPPFLTAPGKIAAWGSAGVLGTAAAVAYAKGTTVKAVLQGALATIRRGLP